MKDAGRNSINRNLSSHVENGAHHRHASGIVNSQSLGWKESVAHTAISVSRGSSRRNWESKPRARVCS